MNLYSRHLIHDIFMSDSLEYSVRVSFLELYNEEIFDLLSAHDDTSRLRLYEDATRKGSVIIQVDQYTRENVDFTKFL